jgi:hypothetical protein
MTEWDLAYMRRRVQPTDADIDRIADAVPVDQIGVHITTWHRRFARAVLAAQPTPVPDLAAENARLREQLALAETVRASQVAGLTEGAEKLREALREVIESPSVWDHYSIARAALKGEAG